MNRLRSGAGDEFALIMIPVIFLLMLLFNAAKTGRFGKKLSEKMWKMSALTQALLFVVACLVTGALGMIIYGALSR